MSPLALATNHGLLVSPLAAPIQEKQERPAITDTHVRELREATLTLIGAFHATGGEAAKKMDLRRLPHAKTVELAQRYFAMAARPRQPSRRKSAYAACAA